MVERLVANEKVEVQNLPAPFKDNKYMTELHNKKCISCDGSIPAFDKSEIHKYLKKLTDGM